MRNSKFAISVYLLTGIIFSGLIIIALFSGNLTILLHEPLLTPDGWLQGHPYVEIGNLLISEPSSSLFIFLLAILYFWIAYMFLNRQDNQQSRIWWGIFMLLFGLGAILAGVSYQAFSFEIKCRGLDYCLWTSWWEIGYMICTVAGVGAAFIGVAHAVLSRAARNFWNIYALASTALYVGVVSYGTIVANRFMISFEMMIIFVMVGFLGIAVHSMRQYRQDRNPLIISILKVGVLLVAVIVIYFVGLVSGYAELLWARGIWFNANDLLHVLLIGWVLYSYKSLYITLQDAKD